MATVLYLDIEGFTTLAENVGAEQLVEVLNSYFDCVTKIIEFHHGVVTQFQGDAVLACFNVPVANQQHCLNAVKASIEIIEAVAQQSFVETKLNVRVGVSTGSVIAGNVGAKGRLNYTVHGDCVNLAARLEALNKEYKTRLMVSADVVQQASNYPWRQLGSVPIRGYSSPVTIYTLDKTSIELIRKQE